MVHERDDRGLLPYQVAIISRLENIALQLLSLAHYKEIVEPAGSYTSLSIAAGRGLPSIVNELLQRGAYPNRLDGDQNITALQMACIDDAENEVVDYPQVVKLLVKLTDLVILKECEESIFQVCIDQEAWKCLKVLIKDLF